MPIESSSTEVQHGYVNTSGVQDLIGKGLKSSQNQREFIEIRKNKTSKEIVAATQDDPLDLIDSRSQKNEPVVFI